MTLSQQQSEGGDSSNTGDRAGEQRRNLQDLDTGDNNGKGNKRQKNLEETRHGGDTSDGAGKRRRRAT